MAQFSDIVRADGTCVLRVHGEIDLAVVGDLVNRLRDCLARANTVEVDFEGVTFIDSSGLGALVLVSNEAAQQAKDLFLVKVSAATSRVFELSGLHDSLVRQDAER